MLETAAVHYCVGTLEDRVVAKWRFPENSDLRGDEFPEPFESAIAACRSEASSGIEGEADPLAGDLSAVEGKSSDIKRHVGQIVIVPRHEVVDAGRWIHSGRNAPRRLGPHGDAS